MAAHLVTAAEAVQPGVQQRAGVGGEDEVGTGPLTALSTISPVAASVTTTRHPPSDASARASSRWSAETAKLIIARQSATRISSPSRSRPGTISGIPAGPHRPARTRTRESDAGPAGGKRAVYHHQSSTRGAERA